MTTFFYDQAFMQEMIRGETVTLHRKGRAPVILEPVDDEKNVPPQLFQHALAQRMLSNAIRQGENIVLWGPAATGKSKMIQENEYMWKERGYFYHSDFTSIKTMKYRNPEHFCSLHSKKWIMTASCYTSKEFIHVLSRLGLKFTPIFIGDFKFI